MTIAAIQKNKKREKLQFRHFIAKIERRCVDCWVQDKSVLRLSCPPFRVRVEVFGLILFRYSRIDVGISEAFYVVLVCQTMFFSPFFIIDIDILT